jgi:hypothetical protein
MMCVYRVTLIGWMVAAAATSAWTILELQMLISRTIRTATVIEMNSKTKLENAKCAQMAPVFS